MTRKTNPAGGNRGAVESDLPGGSIASTDKAPNATIQHSILPAQPEARSLRELAADVRTYHANVLAAFSTAANYAVEAGQKLAIAKQCAGHGRFGEFLRSCEINSRTAARYMQLAGLVKQNGRGTTDLTGVSIERAVKLLSPPKPSKLAAAPKAPTSVSPKPKTHTSQCVGHAADIVSAWISAPPTERINAVDSIGLDGILEAIPASWTSLLEARLAERRQSPMSPLAISDGDLSIPTFLRREAPAGDG